MRRWAVHIVTGLQIYKKGHFLLKFIYSEKATKFCEIFTLLLTTVHTVKSKVNISQNFVAFSEYMNFTITTKQKQSPCPYMFRQSWWLAWSMIQFIPSKSLHPLLIVHELHTKSDCSESDRLTIGIRQFWMILFETTARLFTVTVFTVIIKIESHPCYLIICYWLNCQYTIQNKYENLRITISLESVDLFNI